MKKEKKTIEEIDEETVIVSMEGIDRPSLFGRNRKAEEEMPKEKVDRPWENNSYSRKERLYAIRGALGASLLIWLAYAVVFGIVILLIVLFTK